MINTYFETFPYLVDAVLYWQLLPVWSTNDDMSTAGPIGARSSSILKQGKVSMVPFTEPILQICYWIYKIAIHSCLVILDLHTNKELRNLYYLFLAGNQAVFSLFDCWVKRRECLKTIDLWWPMKKRRRFISWNI
jgi:hypothetical protein